MKNIMSRGITAIATAMAVVSLNGAAMGAYDFDKAWNDVRNAQMKNLPRTVTNKVAEIQREAVAARKAAALK